MLHVLGHDPSIDPDLAGFCCIELDNLTQLALAMGDDAAAQGLDATQAILEQYFAPDAIRKRDNFHGFFIALYDNRPAELAKIDEALNAIIIGDHGRSAGSWPLMARAGIAWREECTTNSSAELSRRAAAACAAARAKRVARSDQPEGTDEIERGASLLCDLLRAMEEDRVKILAQEIRSLHPNSGPNRQYEVLIQVTDSCGHVHPPSEFVPLAENSAIIERLDCWIFRRTLLGYGEALRNHPEISLSLNISGRSLGQPEIWPFLADTIATSGIAPERIQLEITETTAITDMAQAAATVRAARAAGLSVALDDFGAGRSGFGYLTAFDVNCLKIDGGLIPNVVDATSVEASITRSIVALAKELGLEVVAEHVSSPEIIDALTEMGIYKVQGYEISRPQPLDEILGMVNNQSTLE